MGDLIEDLHYYIDRDVAAGLPAVEEIVESAVTTLAHDYDRERLRLEAERLASQAMEEHFRAQATWPEVTDCDRLDQAFTDLERRGIIA